MKQTRRWLICLLTLALMLGLAVGASAEEYPEEMDTSPYLSFHWLNCDEVGWWEDEDGDIGFGMTPYDEMWLIFYINQWNGTEWTQEPVHPKNLYTNENLTITSFSDLEEPQSVYPNQKGEYFCRVTSGPHAWDKEGTISFDTPDEVTVTMNVGIHRHEGGFYTSSVLNNETYIQGEFLVDPFAEENSFYFGFQSNYWSLGDVRFMGEAANYVDWDRDGDTFKITIKPEYAQNIRYEHFNFRIEYTVYRSEEGEDYREETWGNDIWCNSIDLDQPYYLRINETDYEVYEQGYLCNYLAGYGEDEETGETWEIWKQQVTELPEGVSYDIESNTLTLNNARLTQLEAGYAWYDEWSGEGGLNLPTQDLKIELIGENSIVNDHDRAVCFREGVNAIFTGDGSLLVKAVNSEDNTYQHYLHNENGPVLDENGDHKFILVPAQYPAMLIEGGATLTVAGNSNVTAEIAGSALDHCWEWNEELGYDEFIYTDRPAYLSAIAGNGNNLVLKDNATLTTILPEGALYGGIKVETHTWIDEEGNERLDWHEGFGSYAGLNDFHNITVSDNATLNTTTFFVCDYIEWNDETQTETLIEAGSYTQTGGTVNITAQANRSKTEQWGWNEETQRDEYLGIIDHYHYEGLNLRYADVNISGGELNIDAHATEEQLATSAGCEAIPVRGGTFTLSGGTVNINHNMGSGLVVGGYWNEWFDEGANEVRGEGCCGGSANISGGKLNINGTVEPYSEPFMVNAYGSLTLDGGEIHVNGKQSVIGGNVTVNDGSLNITAANDTLDMPGCILILERDASLTVNGGAVNINAHNFHHALFNQGYLTQHGGIINAKSTCDEEWANFHGNEMGDGSINPFKNRGITSVGIITLDGGELNAEGYMGMWVVYEDGDPFNPEWGPIEDGGLYISDEAHANFTGLYRGLQILGQCEISGGNVFATSDIWEPVVVWDSSWDYWYWNEETQQKECIHFGNHSYLNITGGAHYFKGNPDGADALYANNAPITISGGEVELEAAMAFFGYNVPLYGDHYIVSMASGEKMEMLKEVSSYENDEGETVYEYLYYMAEDNVMSWPDAVPDYTPHVIIYANNQCGDNAYWNINDGVLTISGKGPIWDDYFMQGQQQREDWVETPWYALKDHITEIVVEEGITSIPNWTFAHLDKVTKLTLPSTLTEMGTYSILFNTELAEFAVAEGNKDFAVHDKVSLVKNDTLIHVAPATSGIYTVPECVVNIADDACIGTKITDVRFAGDTKVIGNGAFSGCTSLMYFDMPKSVTSIGNGAFSGCTSLSSIHLYRSITSIGQAAFYGVDNATFFVDHESYAEQYLTEQNITFLYAHEFGEASCTSAATCHYCGVTAGPILPHTETVLPAKAATCTETGLTEGKKCSVCGKILTAQNTIAKLPHTEQIIPGKDATETETGLTEGKKCSVCGEILVAQQVIDKLKPSHVHDYKAVVTEATCTAKGYTTYTCSCGHSYTADETPVKAHSFSDWKTTTLPKIGQQGVMTRTCSVCGETETKLLLALSESFTDVNPGDWFDDEVAWAYTNNITTGATETTFNPLGQCTRAQVVTFLWRAAGEPEPTSTYNPFTDVVSGAYYYKAVLWAVENNITNGVSATTFGTNTPCKRGQVVTFLWRTAGQPAPTSYNNPFNDVASNAYYYEAVLWAVENNITTGITKTTFVPDGTCNRAQIVTFLYRYINK